MVYHHPSAMSFNITNYYEPLVVAAIKRYAAEHLAEPHNPNLLEDIACIALNQLPVRYIRYHVDASFFLSTTERACMEADVDQAVHKAFDYLLTATDSRRD